MGFQLDIAAPVSIKNLQGFPLLFKEIPPRTFEANTAPARSTCTDHALHFAPVDSWLTQDHSFSNAFLFTVTFCLRFTSSQKMAFSHID